MPAPAPALRPPSSSEEATPESVELIEGSEPGSPALVMKGRLAAVLETVEVVEPLPDVVEVVDVTGSVLVPIATI